MNAPLTLTQLAAAWQQAKADEHAANARRVEIEQQICAALPAAEAEQTRHVDADGVRITVRYGMTRKVDSDALQALWASLPATAQAAFRWAASPVLPKLRALQELQPETYRLVAPAIEAKPSKPSVSIEEA